MLDFFSFLFGWCVGLIGAGLGCWLAWRLWNRPWRPPKYKNTLIKKRAMSPYPEGHVFIGY